MFLRIILISFLSFSFMVSYQQQTNFEFFNTDPDGLSQSVVTHIMQDSKGYLWISTEDGLNRFDGDDFKRFYREDGLVGHEINCTVEGKNNEIWVASRRGLNLIKNNKIISLPPSLAAFFTKIKTISNLYFSENGVLFLVVNNEIFSWDGTEISSIYKPKQKSVKISSLIDYHDSLFVGTNEGMMVCYSGDAKLSLEKNGFKNRNINCFSVFEDQLLIGTNSGVASYNDSLFYNSKFSFFDTILVANMHCANNRIILAEQVEYFYIYENEKIENFQRDKGSSTARIMNVFIDREASIWISFYGEGLAKYREKPFLTYNKDFNKYHGGTVHCIYYDSSNLWVGGSSGLFYKSDSEQYFNRFLPKRDFKNCEMISNSIWGVLEDNNKRLWICSPRSNIVYYENETFKQLNFSENALLKRGFSQEIAKKIIQAIKNPRTLCIDKHENLWFGTFSSGIVVIDKNKNCIKFFDRSSGLPSNSIQSLLVDYKGSVWVGTANGLARISTDSVSTFENFPELKKATYSLKEARNGTILMATDFGLYELNLKADSIASISHYDIKNGLSSSVVYSMEIDNSENIYLGTTLGVDKVSLGENSTDKIVEKHYGPNEGFQGVECNTNASFKDANGDLWFGTSSISKLRLSYDQVDLVPPRLFINDIRLNYFTLDSWSLKNGNTANIVEFNDPIFSYDQNHLTFDYKAITYVSPKKISYSFKLEPSDTSWSPKTKQRFSTYANLAPGKYTFKVKAQNIDKTESSVVSYSFKIAKPWWNEYWFYTIEVASFFGLIFSFIRIRENRLRRNQLLLEKKVIQRTKLLNVEKIKVENQNKQIKKSINYARRIQNSILPEDKLMLDYFSDFSVFYKPKDIVGGDFYWFRCFGNISVIATVDCTGHGVPGGFMSMMGSLLLDKIIQLNNLDTSKILKDLNAEIVRVLDQKSGGEIQDGMDISLCVIDKSSKKLSFSGARNGITVLRADKIEKYDADLFSVGGSYTQISKKLNRDFKSYSIELDENDWVFMYTDGYYDQLGGSEVHSLGIKRFEKIIKTCSVKEDKIEFLEKSFNDWKNDIPQIDDLLIIGFRI